MEPTWRQPRLPLSEVVRDRIRRQIASELGLTHEKVADRMRALGAAVSRQKVSDVVRGHSNPQLDEIHLWALALKTSNAFLLGFTWDPQPERGAPAAIVGGATPEKLSQHSQRFLRKVPDLTQQAGKVIDAGKRFAVRRSLIAE